ncbi:MAG: hypothetical protein Q9225_000716 [Loekoesia sp. 1 TL-2023]
MPSSFSQAFPPAPIFTEKKVGNLEGKVFLVTGAASGVGFELARLLFSRGGTVYIAARSKEKVDRAIKTISQARSSKGHLHPLLLDLADFPTIKPAVNEFLAKENRLDVLVHNAGLMTPPAGSKNKSGLDLEMATNCLGPFLLNRLLEPILVETAQSKSATRNGTRIVWVSSMITASVPPGGIQFEEKGSGQPQILRNAMQNYMQSKVGNLFLASETAKRLGNEGVLSVAVNPGLMKTELQRHSPKMQGIIMGLLFKGPVYGAYSELFAALSPEITSKRNGAFIIPWGRFGDVPAHIEKGLEPESKGGNGAAERFASWCEKETKLYL